MSKAELFRRIRKNKFFMIGSFMILFLVLAIIFGPLIIKWDPNLMDLTSKLHAPDWGMNGAESHVLGTDNLGRDILARLLYGGRISLVLAICSIIIPSIVGTSLGLLAGYFGKFTDAVITRLTEIFMSIPQMILAIVIMALRGQSLINLVIVVSITCWIGYCRLARGSVMSIRNLEFVKASTVLGAGTAHILFTQILPNVLTPLVISASQMVGSVILLEASLSYLGVGVPLEIPSWGAMIAAGRDYLTTAPWTVLVPGIALMFVVLAFNFLGDGIRDVIDPRNSD